MDVRFPIKCEKFISFKIPIGIENVKATALPDIIPNKEKIGAHSESFLNPFLKYKITGNPKLVSRILEFNGFQKTKRDDFCIYWSSQFVKNTAFQKLLKRQKLNCFPKSYECTRKDNLSRNIARMIDIHGKKTFSFMPLCFVYPDEKDQFESAFNRFASSTTSPNLWIVKPANSCQGRGIYIMDSLLNMPEKGMHLDEFGERHDKYVVERYHSHFTTSIISPSSVESPNFSGCTFSSILLPCSSKPVSETVDL